MIKYNLNLANKKDDYLFVQIAKIVEEYKNQNPDIKLYPLGVGDVCLPLVPAVVQAIHEASEQMSKKETFSGYPSACGELPLRQAICSYYAKKKVSLDSDEIFVTDGAKDTLKNIMDLFDLASSALIISPTYPVYADVCALQGRRVYVLPATEQNGFCPLPQPDTKGDIIFLCSPQNPTGECYSYDQLKVWVDFALKNGSVIVFDAAYEAYVGEGYPRSIFEIPGARQCAIEICSLSKMAGFTGVRCGWAVVPHALSWWGYSVNGLWRRRQGFCHNGVSVIAQRGATAALSPTGLVQIGAQVQLYRRGSAAMAQVLQQCGVTYFGGVHSPYLWVKCPADKNSWQAFFDLLQQQIVCTPGAGFGEFGEGYVRLSSFKMVEDIKATCDQLKVAMEHMGKK